MKISCPQADLARGLAIVGRAVAARSTMAITANVLIASEGTDRLKLSATNLEITMTCWIPARIDEEGAITVPARLLTDFVSTLPNDEIHLTVAPRSRQVRLDCARNEASIGGLDAEDFPPAPVVKDGIAVELDPRGLRQAIAQTVFAAATDDSRPVLTGVNTRFEDSKLTLAASDGFRLSVYDLDLDTEVPERTEIVIPSRALVELNRLLGREAGPTPASVRMTDEGAIPVEGARPERERRVDDEEQVRNPIQLRTNAAKTQVMFRLENVEMVTQLIQGTFPNFSQLIPAGWTTRTTVQVSDFLRETRSAAVFARDGSGIVRLEVVPGAEVSPGKINISARADEVGDNKGEVDAAVEGEGVRIAFNTRYLQDVLQALDGGEVSLETTGPSSQGVFKPVGGRNYVHVIMPMFVQW